MRPTAAAAAAEARDMPGAPRAHPGPSADALGQRALPMWCHPTTMLARVFRYDLRPVTSDTNERGARYTGSSLGRVAVLWVAGALG